ncbi:MHS family MFS transporter [Amycolatopsis acidicola]|uniref:MHS family MFS transporter n=1 Tax=Amycolatopsis acidicola TaxID=2596893 RepID=A0A5N0UYW4_9PSEU|nr:MFS transporter [Amycolatopsis acidicola]KAA9159034.1 MHS family MFS transporter [Amycolatopsis acidicola]
MVASERTEVREETRLRRRDVHVIAVATVGWTIDILDLMVVLNVASAVSKAFFPAEKPMLALTATYASFGISLVVRPLGSLLFGSLADRAGRRRSMAIAVLGSGVATALLGLLPGIGTIGLLAPIGLILMRVVQGVFIGGITASTHTLATESVPERFRGLTSGIIKGGGASLGVAVINVAILVLVAVLGEPAFAAWGWRLVFVFGLVASVLNYALLRKTEESPLWRQNRESAATGRPGHVLFSKQWRGRVLSSIVIVFTGSAAYYVTTGILPTVYKQVFKVDQRTASSLMLITMIGGVLIGAIGGHLSQHAGRRKVLLVSGAAALVCIPGTYVLLDALAEPGTAVLLLGGFLMVVVSGAVTSPLIIFLNERFPTEIRSTATAFTWTVGYGLGGMMPTLVTAVSPDTGSMLPTLIVLSLAISVVFLVSVARSAETRGALNNPTPS